mmetsp:Transcript_3754/g.5242  ORF Transcript_3754/g.5242 Transcript_3754/m.5242 type:complete len:994 (+) Transcript_3754:143-3124(+)
MGISSRIFHCAKKNHFLTRRNSFVQSIAMKKSSVFVERTKPTTGILRIGVDVGGTNTDAVLLKDVELLASIKRPTSEDVRTGIVEAVEGVLNQSGTNASEVQAVMIGTTHFLNALVQRRGLSPVALFRLCGPATRALPPMLDWSPQLRTAVGGFVIYLPGGYEFDGKEITAIDEGAVRQACAIAKERGIRCSAVVGVFSVVNSDQEIRVAEIVREELGEVTLSHELGPIGIVERENSALINASLRPLARATIAGFKEALAQQGLTCPFFFTQNDGTLMNCEEAAHFPVKTFASGPTNSMRGAAFLSGLKDAVVVDIGGTSTDVGVLKKGLTRKAGIDVEIDPGVRTNFQMPDVHSIALGGGTIVEFDSGNQDVTVGPISVGYKLTEDGLAFGGSTMTTTDIAISAGLVQGFGDASKVQHIDSKLTERVQAIIKERVEQAVDRMKISQEDVPVILVGGGSVLLPEQCDLVGANQVVRPPNFGVANAIGAAIAQVSASVNRVMNVSEEGQKNAEQRKNIILQEAKEAAVRAGAIRSTVEVVEIDEVQLSYIPGGAARVNAKAIGDLDMGSFRGWTPEAIVSDQAVAELEILSGVTLPDPAQPLKVLDLAPIQTDAVFSTPENGVPQNKGDWVLSPEDIDMIATGAGMMGCGGGGSPKIGQSRAKDLLSRGHTIRVISPERLREQDTIACVFFMGAPTVFEEKIHRGEEALIAMRRIEREAGVTFSAVVVGEAGGCNCIEPLIVAALSGLPVVDADGMGRAFPELQMVTFFIYDGLKTDPACICDAKGRTELCTESTKPKELEDSFRKHVIEMGCTAGVCFAPMTADAVRKTAVLHSVSAAWQVGSRIHNARAAKEDPFQSLQCIGWFKEFEGKIIGVERETSEGFARGHFIIKGLEGQWEDRIMRIDFQNENLVARRDDEIIATVPDLITAVNLETCRPIMTEELRFGLTVAIATRSAPPQLTSPEALQVVGPAGFHLDLDYQPKDNRPFVPPLS